MSERLHEIDWVALDLEATGVAWGHDRIVEIGAVRFRIHDGRVIPGPRFHALVNPRQPIPEIVSRMTGLTDESVKDAPGLETVWHDFTAYLEGATVLAHGARADLAWLGSEALRLGVSPARAQFYCTLELARRALPAAPRFTLSSLVEHLGLSTEGATYHRALADALHTRNLFARCTTALAAKTLADLRFVEPIPWPGPEVYAIRVPDRLEPLRALVAAQRRCHIVYRGGSAGKTPRPITPLGFFAHEGVAYLRAWCHLGDVGKSFRCDRIATLHLELDR